MKWQAVIFFLCKRFITSWIASSFYMHGLSKFLYCVNQVSSVAPHCVMLPLLGPSNSS